MTAPALYELVRDEDVTGMSGTGVVAHVVAFGDGPVVVRWCVGEHRSTVVWDSLAAVIAIHGHDGRTRLRPCQQSNSAAVPA